MQISLFADTGLRILMAFSVIEAETRMSANELADVVGVPRTHVSKVLTELARLGLVATQRGREGGATLTELGKRSTVGHVLRALETDEDVAACCSPGRSCALLHDCGLRRVLRHAREAFLTSLDDTPIRALPSRAQMQPRFATIPLRATL